MGKICETEISSSRMTFMLSKCFHLFSFTSPFSFTKTEPECLIQAFFSITNWSLLYWYMSCSDRIRHAFFRKMAKLLHSFTPQALVWSEGFYHHCSLKKHNQPVFHVEDPNTQDWRPRLFLSTATIQHLHVFLKN